MLKDNTNWLDLSGSQETYFYSQSKDVEISDSNWLEFPSDQNPDAQYKYASFHLYRDNSLRKIFRSTSGLLDLIAEVGGLSRGLLAIGAYMIKSFSKYALKAKLIKNLVRFKPEYIDEEKQERKRSVS